MILDDMSARLPERLARIEGVELAYYRGLSDGIWQAGGRNEIVWTFVTSVNLFEVLGVGASRVRLYSEADEGPGSRRFELWFLGLNVCMATKARLDSRSS